MPTEQELRNQQKAAEAYSAGDWGSIWRGDPQYMPNWQAGAAAFEARGGPPDLFHNWPAEWER